MRIQIYISVTVLIFVQKSASEATSRPPPPVNVSIQCDSYRVGVRWEYPDLSQDVHFHVVVNPSVYANERKSDTTQNRSLDISGMLFNSGFNTYFVTVTARRGEQESNTSYSVSFSFNKQSTSDKKCYLEFPEIELSPKDGKLHVKFINPLHLYRDTPALSNLSHYHDLIYYINTEEHKNVRETCEMKNKTCETSIEFSEHRGVYCVNLTGEIGPRPLIPKGNCFKGDIRIYPSLTVYLYPLLGVFLTLAFITFILLLIAAKCKSEIKKQASTAYPDCLVIKPGQTHLCEPQRLNPDMKPSYVKIDPEWSPKEQTALLGLEQEQHEEQSSGDRDLGTGYPYKNSVYGANELDDDEEQSSGDPYNNSMYGAKELDDDERGYDCPHVLGPQALLQEMSPGDLVKCYGP